MKEKGAGRRFATVKLLSQAKCSEDRDGREEERLDLPAVIPTSAGIHNHDTLRKGAVFSVRLILHR